MMSHMYCTFCIVIGLHLLKLLLQSADSLQQVMLVLLCLQLCLLLHLQELPLVPELQLSGHGLKETLGHLTTIHKTIIYRPHNNTLCNNVA